MRTWKGLFGAMVALITLTAAGRLVTAAEPKPPVGETKKPPKEISVDLGKGVKLEMILIPAGEFMMGTPDPETYGGGEKPQHRVRITKPFYLGKYPVTQEQWKAVMGKNPSRFEGAMNPVESVSWAECQDYLKALNAKVRGGEFRLPTEAQWEYACRAGSKTQYYFGSDETKLDEYAWYDRNSDNRTHPVGKKKPNAWGLYDMHGNVTEYCADWFDGDYYGKSPTDDPTGPAKGRDRVSRAGSWTSAAAGCRSPMREYGNDPKDFAGLRVSRIVVDP